MGAGTMASVSPLLQPGGAAHRHEIGALRANVVPASPLLPLTQLRQESQSESAAASDKR
jgi:hypothetical protein